MSEFIVKVAGERKRIQVSDSSSLRIDDKVYSFELIIKSNGLYLFILNNKVYEASIVKNDSNNFTIYIEGEIVKTEVKTLLQEKAEELLGSKSSVNHKYDIKSPMPGLILKVKSQPGQFVEAGEPVIILEAMKMENEIRSPVKGILKKIAVNEGDAVEKGAILFTLE